MHRSRLVSPVMVAVAVAIGGGGRVLAQAPESTTPPAGGSGSLQVTVKFSGTPPARQRLKMGADPVCEQQHPQPVYAEDVVVGANGGLQHVFVYVKEGVSSAFPAPSQAATLNQLGCGYTPHVFGLQVSQPLDIVNSDATLHNVNAKPAANQPFNLAQPVKGMKTTKTFAKPEVMVKFKCNVHPWMTAYAGVVGHPFFGVTDANGATTISGLPAGTYTLEAWHEVYGTKTQSVSLGAGESASVELSFSAP